MSRHIEEDFKESLKALMPDYLSAMHGIQSPKRPFCSPWREDRHPSCTMDANTYRVKDWALDESYDVYSLVEKDFHVTNLYEQAKIICQVTGNPFPYDDEHTFIRTVPKKKTQAMVVCQTASTYLSDEPSGNVWNKVYDAMESLETPQGAHGLDYLKTRGFTKNELRRMVAGWVGHPSDVMDGFGYAPKNPSGYICLPFVTMPLWGNKIILQEPVSYCVFRPLFESSAKEYKAKGIAAPVFKEELLRKPGRVFVVEGVFDAWAFEVLNPGKNVCALCGSNKGRLLKVLQSVSPEERPEVILALDNDDAGQRMAISLRDDLQHMGVHVGIAPDYPEGCKDANDVLKLVRCSDG